MLDQLLKLVKENAGEAIINNPAIPNEHNDAAISLATNGIVNALKSQLASGNVSDVLQMLGGKSSVANSGITNAVSQQVAGSLMEKFGINQSAASGIVSSLIPMVLNTMVKKTNDPADNSFDMNSIFNHLSGGKTKGMDVGSLVGSLTGGGNQGSGLSNIIGNVLGGGSQQKGVGLGDLMKMFK